jgi:translation initiation factor IF-2
VRALIDDRGRQLKSAGPATPVEVLGLGGLPSPGDAFQALTDARKARQIATFRQKQAKEKALGAKGARLTLDRCRRRSPKAASRNCRSSSRRTCRARPKCWPTR